jgi:hypothetical protein
MYVGLGNIALWCLGNLFLLVIEMDEEAYLVILYQFWRGGAHVSVWLGFGCLSKVSPPILRNVCKSYR